MTEVLSKEITPSGAAGSQITEEEKERRRRKLLLQWQELEATKTIRTQLDAYIEQETRSIGRRLEAQTEIYSPKCVACGGVGRHLRVDCTGTNWTRVVQA